jgi:PAS domain S-box-containing protein
VDDRLLLSVQDSGPGVSPELRATIFERFRQAQSGTTRQFGGTGLGLAIAKDFVDLHGGTIAILDAPGGGALFQVEIPQRAPAGAYVRADEGPPSAREGGVVVDDALEELQPVEVDTAEDTGSPARPLLLVAEDNTEMRRFIARVLGDEYHIMSAADGAEALTKALAKPPDLVVTDLMMPKLGGDQLIAEMRAREPLASVPVLVLSAKADEELRLQLLAEAVQDYVIKPFSAHELRARVRNLVMMQRARTELQKALATQNEDVWQLTQQLVASRQTLQRGLDALQESEQRWRAVYENSAVGIGLTDVRGRFLAANPGLQSMLGYTEAELHNVSILELTPEEDREAAWARLTHLVEGRLHEYHVERRYLRKDGRVMWANTSVSVIPGTESLPRMLVRIIEDITERKRAEEAMAEMQTELARVTRVTTMGELAASIAHEVNQPLTGVVSNGNACLRWLAREVPDLGEARAAVERIIRDANRASEVIRRIRAFVKKTDPQKVWLDINDLIHEVVTLVQSEVRKHRVALRTELSAVLPPVLGDRVQLQQVLLNLLLNGIEAMHPITDRPRELRISSQRPALDTVLVAVQDSGIGLDPQSMTRLFDAFFTTKPTGLGLGLSISRSISQAHGGQLWALPNAGPGATFQLTLPTGGERVA